MAQTQAAIVLPEFGRLHVVKGHVVDTLQGRFPHAWCENENGEVVDLAATMFFHIVGREPWKDGRQFSWGKCSFCGDPITRVEPKWPESFPKHLFCIEMCEREFDLDDYVPIDG
jgi:hypothetical protein